MSQLFDLVLQVLGQILGHPAVGFALEFGALYLAILWLASAYWVYRDARHRTTDVLTPYVAAAAVVLLTPVFFVLAVVVWRVLRPGMTRRERFASGLQRTLLEADAAHETCPSCSALVDEGWVRCPSCGVQLASTCAACGRQVGLDWAICAWCAADLPWVALPAPALAPEPVAPAASAASSAAALAESPAVGFVASSVAAPEAARGPVVAAGPGLTMAGPGVAVGPGPEPAAVPAGWTAADEDARLDPGIAAATRYPDGVLAVAPAIPLGMSAAGAASLGLGEPGSDAPAVRLRDGEHRPVAWRRQRETLAPDRLVPSHRRRPGSPREAARASAHRPARTDRA